jgi:uncharacterized repeat protein (TIGR02543 family)
MNMKKIMALACMALAVMAAVGARAGTVTDDFSTSQDYLTAGVSGTLWDGIHNQSAANVLNTTGTAGELTIQTPGGTVGWEGTKANAPFLYKSVTGDFDVRVQTTAGTTANYTVAGLLVRLDPANADGDAGEDFVMLARNWFRGTIQLRSVNNNGQSDSDEPAAQAYLRLTRTGNVFRGYTSSDGTTWTQRAWGGGSTDLTRTDLGGTVQVGLTGCNFSGATTSVRFDNFILTTPNTVTYDGNGSTGGTVPADSSSPYASGATVTVLGVGSLMKTGYAFAGWNTQALGGGTAYSAGNTFVIAANTTLYAQWTAATATLTAPANFPGAVSTTYGTASSATSVAVAGADLTADITATAPGNLEVSSDGSTFGGTATFTQSGGTASGTLYVRIKNNAPVSGSPYNSQNVVLTSAGATTVNVATTASGNTVAAKALTVASATAQSKAYDGTAAATVTATLQTAEAFGAGNSLDGQPYTGDTLTVSVSGSTFASSAVGNGIAVTAGTFTLGGASAGNYTLTQPTGLSLSANILATAVWTQSAGGSWPVSANWQDNIIGAGANETADFGTLTLPANTTVTLDGARTIGNLSFDDQNATKHAWTLNTGSGGPLTLAVTSGTPVISNNVETTLGVALAGSQGLNKTGTGTLILSSTTPIGNSYTGTTTVNGGTLALAGYNVASGGYNNMINGNVIVNSGGILRYDSTGNINVSSTITLNGGILNLQSFNQYMSTLTLSNGAQVLGDLSGSQFVIVNGSVGAKILGTGGGNAGTISSRIAIASQWGVVTGARTQEFDVAPATTLTVSGPIVNYPAGSSAQVGSLLKSNSGTLTLSGVNTYTGSTIISGGTLVGVAGGSCASSAVTVTNTPGSLAALGVSVTDSALQWTCSSLTFNTNGEGAQLQFRFAVTPSLSLAPLKVTGDATFNGTPLVVVDPANLVTGQKYPLLTVGGMPPGTVPTLSITGMSGTLAWEGNTLYLTIPPAGTLISFF